MTSRFCFPLLACFVLLGCGDSVGADFAWLTGEPDWVVRLEFGDTHVCTGFVLSEHWLLTAGHCVESASDGKIKVSQKVFGVRTALYDGSAELILHPEYTDRSRILTHRWHDVGLIRLEGEGLDLDGRGRLCGEVSTPEVLTYGDET
ncbi:MAG: trypsin-like serine protease, partial [Polyangiales bacterium]